MTDFGSNRDRHENLGDGKIGADGHARRSSARRHCRTCRSSSRSPGSERRGPGRGEHEPARACFHAEGVRARGGTSRPRFATMLARRSADRTVSGGPLRRRHGSLEVRNPYSGAVIAEVATGDRPKSNAPSGTPRPPAPTPPAQRARVLERAAELSAARAEHFARVVCREAGKPIRQARAKWRDASTP